MRVFNAKKLREFLTEKGYSQKRFGELVGVTDMAINRLIKGYKQPSSLLLSRIADAMGCSMDDLMIKVE